MRNRFGKLIKELGMLAPFSAGSQPDILDRPDARERMTIMGMVRSD